MLTRLAPWIARRQQITKTRLNDERISMEYTALKAAREMARPGVRKALEMIARARRREAMALHERYGRDFFVGEDDEAGIPWDNFLTALQVWSFLRPSDERATVQEAADQFDVTTDVIRQAVNEHPWMLLMGPDDDPTKQQIDHDGE
jgi:hypothetical protein